MADTAINQQASPQPSPNTSLWFLLVLNVIAALGTIPATSAAVGVGKVTIVSIYREYDLNGLINREAVQTYDNGRFAGPWTRIPDYLGYEAFKYLTPVAIAVTIVFGINAVCLAFLIRKQGSS